MASDIALNIQTGYQDSGIKKATKDVRDFGSETTKSAEDASKSMEGLFRRIERPIGMIAFSGLAEQLTDMGTRGQSTGMMVERGLHAAGMGLLYFNPLLGMAVIASTALYEAFNKVEGAAVAEGDAIAKAADEAQKASEVNDTYTAALLKQGKITQAQANQLSQMHHESMDKTKDDKEATAEQLKYAEALLNTVKAGKFLAGGYREMFDSLQGVGHAQKMYNEALEKFNQANGPEAADKKKKPKEDMTWMTDKLVAQEKLSVSTMKLGDIEKREAEYKKQLLTLDQQMASASTKAQVLAIQTQINQITRLDEVDKQRIELLKQNEKQTEEVYKRMGDMVEKFSDESVQSLLDGGKEQKKALQQMAKDAIQLAAQQATAQLQIQAVRDLANPATVGIGIAEMAAIGAINGVAGAIGAAITGGGGSSSPTSASTSTGQNNVTTPSASGQGQSGSSNLQIYVQGGVIDDNFAMNLAKRLSDVVQQNGVPLVASSNLQVSYR